MEQPATPAEREPNGMAGFTVGMLAPIATGVGTLLVGIAAVITALR
jgi:hypothetical protein